MKPLPHLQLRVRLSPASVFGPGKADLLEHIAADGSISAAARRMRMSYKRAWQLVDDMNRAFRAPLVTTSAGGTQGGGAAVTANGKRVLACYRSLQNNAETAVRRELAALARLGAKAL
jgi:molybdate transport system regulatory protein